MVWGRGSGRRVGVRGERARVRHKANEPSLCHFGYLASFLGNENMLAL